MPHSIRSILKSLPKRITRDAYGIATAYDYLRPLAISGSKKFDTDWHGLLRQAKRSLAYTGRECVVTKAEPAKAAAPTKGAIFEYETIVTTGRTDRAGDILDPMGAQIDANMPVLWQHFPHEPCGKMIEVVEQSDSRIVIRNALIDSPLGRDAAQLVEFGALRTSHGFRPIEFSALPEGVKNEDEIEGWHVKTYEMMETSLVSVPCNTDAVITAFSRNKLCHPAVKSFAKGLHDSRTKILRSTDVPKGEPSVNINVNLTSGKVRRSKAAKAAAIETKDAKMATKACIDGAAFAGSWESRTSQLNNSLGVYLAKNGIILNEDRWAYVVVMFDESAIVCVTEFRENDSPRWAEKLYRCAWAMNGDVAEWTGEPVEVQLTQAIVPKVAELQDKAYRSNKALLAMGIKAGRVLSQKNAAKVSAAIEHCKGAIECLEELNQAALSANDDTLEGEQPTEPGQHGNDPDDEAEAKAAVAAKSEADELSAEDVAALEALSALAD